MKKIKVKICGHGVDVPYGYSYFLLTILKKYYDVELSESPDYLFYNDSTYDHYKYDCVKIYYTGENVSPNFNHCDYAISYDYLTFEDRHYRMPMYLVRVFYNLDDLYSPEKDYLTESTVFTLRDLEQKKEFCSFVYSNYRGESERKEMFETLNTYKKVNSAGAYLNNTGNKKLKDKLSYELMHKFSIAFENSSRSGYTTEKIVNALAAKTIPIYWGNPNIHKEFNTKRFINCHDYSSFDEVLEVVKKIDKNDELYLSMINEPISIADYNYNEVRAGLETFIRNIIDQPLESAKRATINPVIANSIKNNNKIIELMTSIHTILLKIASTVYKPFKKIKPIEKIKHNYFSKK